jgi:putative MATE family efflux protein
MDRTQLLGSETIPRLLLRFSLPAIVGMLVNALYNIVDRIFIGNSVGSLGLAGVTIGFPIMLIVMACTMLIGLGANSLVSIRLGEGRKEEAERILANALVLLVLVSIAITILGLVFLDPVLVLFGASKAVLPYARDYMRIILAGVIFQGLGFGMNNFIRGAGDPKTAMLTMLIGAVLNAILCPIFIFGFGWGIKGSALATVLSQAASASWVLAYFVAGRGSLRLRSANLGLRPKLVASILALGSAPFIMQLAASLVQVIFNKSLERYGGDTAISGMGIVMAVSTLIMMPIFGINQGVQPIIGFNYGARNLGRVREALVKAILVATAIDLVGFAGVELFSRQIVLAFNHNDAALVDFATGAMRLFLVFLPIIGFQVISANYFQAVGKPRQASFLSLSRQLLLLVPAVLVLPLFFGLRGVLYAGPLSDLCSSLLTGFWILREMARLKAEEGRAGPGRG